MVLRSGFVFILLCKIVSIQAQNDLIETSFDFENKNECLVKEKRSKTEKPCEFPFIYENKTYWGCSTYAKYKDGRENFNERPWCSTRTDPISSQHIPGERLWGDCPQDGSCLTSEEGQEAEELWENNESSE